MSALRLPVFISFRSIVATCARISPFLLQGRKGVCSVITPSTFPYIYTLSKKTSLAFARLAASMALRMIRGHSDRHTVMSYFRPTSRNATLEPETAATVSSRLERSAATASAAPGTSLGFRLTSRMGSFREVSSLASSLPIAPPAPRMVTIVACYAHGRNHLQEVQFPGEVKHYS